MDEYVIGADFCDTLSEGHIIVMKNTSPPTIVECEPHRDEEEFNKRVEKLAKLYDAKVFKEKTQENTKRGFSLGELFKQLRNKKIHFNEAQVEIVKNWLKSDKGEDGKLYREILNYK